MKCLFVFQDCPLSYNYSGSASRRMMDFKALHSLGVELHVLRLLNRKIKHQVLSFEAQYPSEVDQGYQMAATWSDVDYDLGPQRKSMIPMANLLVNPVGYLYPNIDLITSQFNKLLQKISPDIIWTGYQPSSIVVLLSKAKVPWIHYIGDWRHELRLLRKKSTVNAIAWIRARIMANIDLRLDRRILDSCTVIETASTVQKKEIMSLSKTPVVTVRQFYEQPSERSISLTANQHPKIIHLGSLRTTSNLIGLIDYLEKVHPEVNKVVSAPLTVVGDTDGTSDRLKTLLTGENIRCTGRVVDLEEVFKPYDIGIIPYNYNTGMRTKVALFHRFKIPVLTFKKPIEGMKEIENNINAIVVDSFEQFKDQLLMLINSRAVREKLGNAGFERFIAHNSLKSQIRKYKKILNIATGKANIINSD